MKEQTRLFLIILLCVIIVASVFVGKAAIRLRRSSKPNPNYTLVTTPEQVGFEPHPEWDAEAPAPAGSADNLAAGKAVSDNGHTDVYQCGNAVDGDRQTYWEGSANLPNELTVDLGAETGFGACRLLLNPDAAWGKRTQEVEVQISSDGESFTSLGEKIALEFDPATGNEAEIAFTDVQPQGRYVRFVFHANTGAAGGQVAEIEIYAP